MFPNLNAEMARRKITIKTLADLADINYESLKNKMNGTTEFKRSEMYSIKKKVFPDFTIFHKLNENLRPQYYTH